MKLCAFPWAAVSRDGGRGRINAHEWLDLAREIGLDGIELPSAWCGPQDDPAYIRRFQADLAARGLSVGMYTLALDNWSDPHTIEAAKPLVELAATLGATRLRMLTQRWQPQIKEMSPNRAIRVSIEGLSRVAEIAASADLQLAIENHHDHIGTRLEHFVQLMNGLPQANVGCNLDPKHPARVGEDLMTFVTHPKVIRRLKCTHLDNFADTVDGWDRSGSLDEGDLDLEPVIRTIKASGYDDWLSIEYGGSAPHTIRRSVQWVRKIWDRP